MTTNITKETIDSASKLNNVTFDVATKLTETTGTITNETTKNTGNIMNTGLSNIGSIFSSILSVVTAGFKTMGSLVNDKTNAYIKKSQAQNAELEAYLQSDKYKDYFNQDMNQKKLNDSKKNTIQSFTEIMDTLSITLENIKENCTFSLQSLIQDYENIHKCSLRYKYTKSLCKSTPISMKIMNKQTNISSTIDKYKNKININKSLITSNIASITDITQFSEQTNRIKGDYIDTISKEIENITKNFEADLESIITEIQASIPEQTGSGKRSRHRKTIRKPRKTKRRKLTKVYFNRKSMIN